MMSTKTWSIDREIPQPQIASHAEQFAKVAEFLFKNLPTAEYAVPSILLEAALALELFLKSLNAQTVSHPTEIEDLFLLTASPLKFGHTLISLYDAIDESLRLELQDGYSKANLTGLPSEFRQALDMYSNLFVDIRYAFERSGTKNGSMDGLVKLVSFVRNHIGGMPGRKRISENDYLYAASEPDPALCMQSVEEKIK